MKVVIGGDHNGFQMKKKLLMYLDQEGYEVIHLGVFDETLADFPVVTVSVTDKILSGEAERGIIVCGSGIGPLIAANKIAGIRAALVHDAHCAHQCVEHDDANVMCIGGLVVGEWLARDLVKSFLEAKFSIHDEDRRRRVQKLNAMDQLEKRG